MLSACVVCQRNMSACVEKRGIFSEGWVVVCSLGWES